MYVDPVLFGSYYSIFLQDELFDLFKDDSSHYLRADSPNDALARDKNFLRYSKRSKKHSFLRKQSCILE